MPPAEAALFVLCNRQHNRDNHPAIFAPVNDALLAFSNLHRYGTDWTGFWLHKGLGLPLHTSNDRAK